MAVTFLVFDKNGRELGQQERGEIRFHSGLVWIGLDWSGLLRIFDGGTRSYPEQSGAWRLAIRSYREWIKKKKEEGRTGRRNREILGKRGNAGGNPDQETGHRRQETEGDA
jgi:hypothetical protein